MSACFYDIGGAMLGIDLHKYITSVGPMYVPLPVPFTPHLVMADFNYPTTSGGKRLPTVVAEGRRMIQRGFKIRLVLHFPLTSLVPHAAEVGQLAYVIMASWSKAYLGVASVTGEGASLATCIASSGGVNGHCLPGAGAVYNASSVITSPSTSDFAGAVAAFATDLLLKKVVKLPFPLKFVFKKVVQPIIEEKVRELVEFALS